VGVVVEYKHDEDDDEEEEEEEAATLCEANKVEDREMND
jgi:hypothetical protein